ncbi:muskelin isoform X1 [Sitodiplosis mosellana]|uniref:muskelin isoform X1 n=2 Tax=Sitodiplosis mosellana TaxID=263140 RepID=UPI002443C782|nr:muskelin isoform X1 [Sitodiplosis mosellana]
MDHKLTYEIYKYSSYSTSYLPENIREDCPSNQVSRWSSNTNTPPQFLTLKLQRPAIVKKIKFGKYEKTHVCNLRKFKVIGGLEEEHMLLLFEGGLRNDSIPETFDLRHKTDSGELMPLMYISIIPLLSWGPSFNFSIWYVEIIGQDDPLLVRSSLRHYNMLREVELVRLCLKHFRQQGYDSAFRALQDQTNVILEDPMMSELHSALVVQGDFQKAENFVEKAVNDGLMDNYLANQDYKATWALQETVNSEKRPGMRGGHQLIIDSANCVMYLFGGWDGFEDLSDLWCYNIKRNSWTLIHERAEQYGGPSPRSCHKMVYDPCNSQIFTLGRYLDSTTRTQEYIKSDFYLYDTKAKTWTLICDDTSQEEGPNLIFDHQMCIDIAKRNIYVFGGRILMPRNIDVLPNDPVSFSGLFSYHIPTNTWTQILVDQAHPTASNPEVMSIKSRVTHCMLFHHRHRKLYIFGGQRNKEYTTDFISFDVDTQNISVVNTDSMKSENNNKTNVPQSGFTQRATIDCERDEIYVLSSLSKEKDRRDLNLNSFWMYSLKTNKWSCIYKSEHSNEHCYSKVQSACSEPCPRYAHQLVYDWINKVHYLFGGNPGRNTTPELRLDDFWLLYLKKPSRQQILRHCKYLIRRLEYEEIVKTNSIRAVGYLQTRLSEIIDHNDPEQLQEFHKLASLLFKCDDYMDSDVQTTTASSSRSNSSAMEIDPKSLIINQLSGASSDSNDSTTTTSRVHIDSKDWNMKTERYHNYTPPPPTICCYGANTLKKDAELFTSKSEEQQSEVKNQRCLLYNKLIELMPDTMVQPKSNLTDFVVI